LLGPREEGGQIEKGERSGRKVRGREKKTGRKNRKRKERGGKRGRAFASVEINS